MKTQIMILYKILDILKFINVYNTKKSPFSEDTLIVPNFFS